MHTLRRDIEEMLEDFEAPRDVRREIDRLFGEGLSARSTWRELDRLLGEFVSPPTLRRRVANLFQELSPSGRGGRGGMFVPHMDLIERENEYVMRVDLPGVREQDIDVQVDRNNILTIEGERRHEESRRERGYEYTERQVGSFSRSVELPYGVDAQRIEAEFHSGVLEIHIPKSKEAGRGRRVQIGRGEEREQPRIVSPQNGGSHQEVRP